MQFCEALGLGRGITSIIGSGGKSSLLDRLAEDVYKRQALFSELPSNVFGLVISLILILIISLFDKNGQREKTADI